MIKDTDVKYIANLARIYLDEEETERFTKDLEAILDYINKLSKLDTGNIKPTSHVLPLKNVYRQDNIHKSLTQEEALKFAVEKYTGSFKVPKIIE